MSRGAPLPKPKPKPRNGSINPENSEEPEPPQNEDVKGPEICAGSGFLLLVTTFFVVVLLLIALFK